MDKLKKLQQIILNFTYKYPLICWIIILLIFNIICFLINERLLNTLTNIIILLWGSALQLNRN